MVPLLATFDPVDIITDEDIRNVILINARNLAMLNCCQIAASLIFLTSPSLQTLLNYLYSMHIQHYGKDLVGGRGNRRWWRWTRQCLDTVFNLTCNDSVAKQLYREK